MAGTFLPPSTAATLSFHDDLVGNVGEAIQGGLGQDGIIEEGDPFLNGPVGGDDGGASPVTLDDDLIEVAGLLGAETTEPEVVDDQEVRSQETPEHLLGGVVPDPGREPPERASLEWTRGWDVPALIPLGLNTEPPYERRIHWWRSQPQSRFETPSPSYLQEE